MQGSCIGLRFAQKSPQRPQVVKLEDNYSQVSLRNGVDLSVFQDPFRAHKNPQGFFFFWGGGAGVDSVFAGAYRGLHGFSGFRVEDLGSDGLLQKAYYGFMKGSPNPLSQEKALNLGVFTLPGAFNYSRS